MAAANIIYSGFFDYPLAFVVTHAGSQYLFWRDDEVDEFPDEYQVSVLPGLSEEEIRGSWSTLRERATHHLGTMPVRELGFDRTHRLAIDTSALERMRQLSSGPR